MKIITWNVNRFDGVWDWYHFKGDLAEEEREEHAKKIVEKLSELLTNPDDIAILQEIPYYNSWRRSENKKKEWNNKWKYFFENFKVMFWFDNEQESKELFNLKAKNVTIAVAAKDSYWNLRSFQSKSKKIIFGKTKGAYDYANNYVELENGNMSMLGLHANGKKEYWKQIHEATGKSDFSFIVGDFNVNDFLYPVDNELHKLETNYDRLIDKDIITQNQTLTSIDNIFVKKGISSNAKIVVWDYCYIPETKGYAVRNTRYSDHNICICEIEI